MTLSTNHIAALIFVLGSHLLSAQQIDPDAYRFVIGAASFSAEANGAAIDATAGEAVTFTGNSLDLIITQGFQQSNYILVNPYSVDLAATSEACNGASDGSVVIESISSNLTAPYTYEWSNGATTSSISQLTSGFYSVTVTDVEGFKVTNTIEVEVDNDVDCAPEFYTGITPNGDGFNEQWVIENAEYFTTREVRIFNRYGDPVWRTDRYDNFSDFFEGKHRNGADLPDGTYFYTANFNGVEYEGWIEITR